MVPPSQHSGYIVPVLLNLSGNTLTGMFPRCFQIPSSRKPRVTITEAEARAGHSPWARSWHPAGPAFLTPQPWQGPHLSPGSQTGRGYLQSLSSQGPHRDPVCGVLTQHRLSSRWLRALPLRDTLGCWQDQTGGNHQFKGIQDFPRALRPAAPLWAICQLMGSFLPSFLISWSLPFFSCPFAIPTVPQHICL